MTKKEKRVLFIEINPQDGTACLLLDTSYDLAPVCALTNRDAHCKECRKGMTRAEAVEKMAGEMFGAACAICGDPEKTWRDCDLLPTTIIFYLGMAEAALDALLEVSK